MCFSRFSPRRGSREVTLGRVSSTGILLSSASRMRLLTPSPNTSRMRAGYMPSGVWPGGVNATADAPPLRNGTRKTAACDARSAPASRLQLRGIAHFDERPVALVGDLDHAAVDHPSS